MTTVYSIKELEKSLTAKESKIIIKGELAEKMTNIKDNIKKENIKEKVIRKLWNFIPSHSNLILEVTPSVIVLIGMAMGFSLALIGLLKDYDISFNPDGSVTLTNKQ